MGRQPENLLTNLHSRQVLLRKLLNDFVFRIKEQTFLKIILIDGVNTWHISPPFHFFNFDLFPRAVAWLAFPPSPLFQYPCVCVISI
jgi:hypothetical protein